MEDISVLLTDVLAETKVPSLVAAVVFGSEVRAAGAVGVRKRGDVTPVTLGDKYHIGSCTKAMTASLAGMLVERGTIAWDSSLEAIFPELTVHPGYSTVTLSQLLTHTGGFPANPHDELWQAVEEAKGSPQEVRGTLILPGLLGEAPNILPETFSTPTQAIRWPGRCSSASQRRPLKRYSLVSILDRSE